MPGRERGLMSLYLKGTSVYLYHGKRSILSADTPDEGISFDW